MRVIMNLIRTSGWDVILVAVLSTIAVLLALVSMRTRPRAAPLSKLAIAVGFVLFFPRFGEALELIEVASSPAGKGAWTLWTGLESLTPLGVAVAGYAALCAVYVLRPDLAVNGTPKA